MNERHPWIRLDVVFFAVFVIAVFWWISEPAPWVEEYIQESRGRIDTANNWANKYLAVIQANLAEQSRSRLAGSALVLVTGLILAVRARWQFLHTPRFTERVCPICGGEIVRVHRYAWQRSVEKLLLLPTRRYMCRNPECRWKGLRFGRLRRGRPSFRRRRTRDVGGSDT
jgi:hypothetical protein